MKIVAHVLVKNEENFIWYAINSVINHVDELMVWDMGSTDKTVEIIKTIKNSKIKFKSTNVNNVTKVRQQMLSATEADWLFILDGDEIWHNEQIRLQIEKIRNAGNEFDVVVNKNLMLIGDMFHFQEELAGRYHIQGRSGHLTIRFIRNKPGLVVSGSYPLEAFSINGVKVQELPKSRINFSDNFYLHASFLERSSRDAKKLKYEIGERLPYDYFYPEVFFLDKPEIVPGPWKIMKSSFRLKSMIQTPIKKIRRRVKI